MKAVCWIQITKDNSAFDYSYFSMLAADCWIIQVDMAIYADDVGMALYNSWLLGKLIIHLNNVGYIPQSKKIPQSLTSQNTVEPNFDQWRSSQWRLESCVKKKNIAHPG